MDIKPVYVACSKCGAARKEKTYRGSDLRRVRQRNGVTLREMAKRVKKSAAFISDVELGRRRASAELVAAYEALPEKNRTLAKHGELARWRKEK